MFFRKRRSRFLSIMACRNSKMGCGFALQAHILSSNSNFNPKHQGVKKYKFKYDIISYDILNQHKTNVLCWLYLLQIIDMDRKLQVKSHLMTAEYGRFDLIDFIVPKDVLLIAPPRIIVSYLVTELEIQTSDINLPALRSWLFNYRKKLKKIKPGQTSIAPDLPTATSFFFTDTKGTVSGKKFDF